MASNSLSSLPTELYSAILDHVPPNYLRYTILSLSRCLPHCPIPLHQLFQCIRLTYADQAIHLNRRLRTASDSAASWVREFSLESWTVDADIVINVVRMMSELESLKLCIGPNSFAPEHLEEMFVKPIPGLRYLSLRFRPYVQKATYYQFLKGAYFDSTLQALAAWPASSLPTFSIVQDPLDPGVAQRQAFAQPLVFFRLDLHLSLLVCSPFLSALKSFRLRIPSRPIARCIATHPRSLPSLEFLDLTTCNVLEDEVETLLVRFAKLKHLILDGCSILRGELRESEWSAMGKRCALVGARRAKEREKKLRAWLEANAPPSTSQAGPQQQAGGPNAGGRRTRRGRRGLATATISLRDSPPRNSNIPLPKKPDVPVQKIRILPPFPILLSLATTISPLIAPEKYEVIRGEFETGWAEGIAQLGATRARLRQSLKNGFRIMRFAGPGEDEDDEGLEEGLDGLVDIEHITDSAFESGHGDFPMPVLCLVGSGKDKDHVERCGHSVGAGIWQDEL